MKHLAYWVWSLVLVLQCPIAHGAEREFKPLVVGLDADMSSGSAESGIAIKRGIELAVERINDRGGVLGRPLSLVVRDHQGNPSRGMDNIREFAAMDGVIAVVGGLHTPVALAELPLIHEHRMIYLGPWAAGTPIVDNGYSPNYVFRVSVRDSLAGAFLIEQALKRGYKRPALLLENTGWGRSNEKAMSEALKLRGIKPVSVQWFNWGINRVAEQYKALKMADADVIIMVANAPEGVVIVKHLADLRKEDRLPVISHWGITGGDFFKQAGSALAETHLLFLQTFSFSATSGREKTRDVVREYSERYGSGANGVTIPSPAGTAHAYDLIHLLAMAVKKAGTTERSIIRDELENLDSFEGLVRTYAPPFTPERHDALTQDDFYLARFSKTGDIIRVQDPVK